MYGSNIMKASDNPWGNMLSGSYESLIVDNPILYVVIKEGPTES